MSSFVSVPNTLTVYGVWVSVSQTPPSQLRATQYYTQQSGQLLLSSCTWKQEGSVLVTPAGFYLQSLPAGSTTQIAQVINQDPVTYVSVISANGASYRLAPNGGCLLLTSSTLGIGGPNGTSTWQVLAVQANGATATVNAALDFFFAGF
jgi:hypothetical protein